MDEGKLHKEDDVWEHFKSADSAKHVVKLKAFSKFEGTAEALESALAVGENKVDKVCV